MTIIVHYVSLENMQNIYKIVVFCYPDVPWGSFLLSLAEDVTCEYMTYTTAASRSGQAPGGTSSIMSIQLLCIPYWDVWECTTAAVQLQDFFLPTRQSPNAKGQ